MYRIVFFVFSSLFLFRCTQKREPAIHIPFYNQADFTPIFIKRKEDIPNQIQHTIANFSFLNQDSVLVNQTLIEGKIHVANFIFTSCPGICPTMTSHMKMVSDSLTNHPNLFFLSFSVTPWLDKPYILKRYKNVNDIKNNNWHFLTGSKNNIYELARKSYFAEEDIGFSKDSTEFLHTEHFILVDKSKRIRGVYNGTLVVDMYQLISDINTIEKEE